MKYSIITINYNNRDGLERTIQSVINQTCLDYEYIIIDGGSTDGSVDIIKKYADRIDYWVSEPDKGIYNAMNKGVLQAHGDYVNFMNSGDCFYDNNVLEVVRNLLYTDIVVGKCYYEGGLHGFSKQDITLLDLYKCHLQHQASFIYRELQIKYPYDENLKIISDWKFFVQSLIFDNASFSNVDIIICDYESNGISKRFSFLIEKEKIQVLSSLFPPRLLKDYNDFYCLDYPLSQLVSQFGNAGKFKTIIYHLLRMLIKMRELYNKLFK